MVSDGPLTSFTGNFNASIVGLTPSTRYYVRAYGTNSFGTGYSETFSFTTQGPAILTTATPSSLTSSSAMVGGAVTADGGSAILVRGVVYSTRPNPTTTQGQVLRIGQGGGTFSSQVTGLLPNTTYYLRAYAVNSSGLSYGPSVIFQTLGDCPAMVTDMDGNTYNTVRIGSQCWMKENLRVTRFRSGEVIPLDATGGDYGDFIRIGTDPNVTWDDWSIGARSLYGRNNSNVVPFGYLYNFHAASHGGLCPQGWHVPSDGEWNSLINFLGGEAVAGGQMKTTTGWNPPNSGASNASGFSAIPSGCRSCRLFGGAYTDAGEAAFFWSTTAGVGNVAYARILANDTGSLRRTLNWTKTVGASVRCLKN